MTYYDLYEVLFRNKDNINFSDPANLKQPALNIINVALKKSPKSLNMKLLPPDYQTDTELRPFTVSMMKLVTTIKSGNGFGELAIIKKAP
jgi:hypothetical protein